MKRSTSILLIFSLIYLGGISKFSFGSIDQKNSSVKPKKLELSVSLGSSMRLGNVSLSDINIGTNSASGFNYSICMQYYLYKRLGIGAIFSDMWVKNESYKNADGKLLTTSTKLQYIGFYSSYNLYTTEELMIKFGLSIGEMNYFDATKYAFVKGHNITYGIHTQFIYMATNHIGFTFIGSLIPASLNKLSVESRDFDLIISSGKVDKKNIGKFEAGIGLVFLL